MRVIASRQFLVLGIVWVTIAAFTRFELARVADSDTRGQADRVTSYQLGAGRDPVFPLPGGASLIRLVTNAIMPADLGAQDLDYTVNIEVVDPSGQTITDHDFHLRTRRSAAADARSQRAASEAACTDGEGSPIADSRRVDLQLAEPAQPGTTFSVHTPTGVPVLARAWSYGRRMSPHRQDRLLRLYDDLRAPLKASLGINSWDRLRQDEVRMLTTFRFRRLAASGRPGSGYLPHEIYVRDAVAAPDVLESEEFDLRRPRAFVVQGPTEVEVQLGASMLVEPAEVLLEAIGSERRTLATVDLTPEQPSTTWLGTIPEGRWTVTVSATSAVVQSLLFHVAVHAPLETHVLSGRSYDRTEVSNHVSTLHTDRAGGSVFAILDAQSPADASARTLEIEVWAPANGPLSEPSEALKLSAHTLGSETRLDAVDLDLKPNPWDAWVDDSGVERDLYGPARVRLLVPRDTRRVVVETSSEAFVRFRVPLAGRDRVSTRSAEVRAIGLAEDAPSRTWVRPLSSGGQVEVRVQSRVVPPPDPPSRPAWAAVSLSPMGLATRLQAVEALTGPATGPLLTEVTAGKDLRVLAGGMGTIRPRLRYEVDNLDALGRTSMIFVDGVEVGEVRPTMFRGSRRLPALSPGVHTIRSSLASGLRMFVNLPPAPGVSAAVYRSRTVWRLGRRPVVLAVKIDRKGPRALNVVVYDPAMSARDDRTFSFAVDGGHARRRRAGIYTRTTPDVRVLTLPEASTPNDARVIDGDRASLGHPRTLILPLGDDLAPGLHHITLRASTTTHARFFVLSPPGVLQDQGLRSSDGEN